MRAETITFGYDVLGMFRSREAEGEDAAIDGLNEQLSREAEANAIMAAGLGTLGGGEALIAQLGVSLDRMSEQARAGRQEMRKLRDAQKLEAIEDRRRAADQRMHASFMKAGASVAGSYVGKNNKQAGDLISGLGESGSSVLTNLADNAEADAMEHDLTSQQAGEAAEDAGEAAQSMDRFRDKAQGHLEQLQRARLEARMTASRF